MFMSVKSTERRRVVIESLCSKVKEVRDQRRPTVEESDRKTSVGGGGRCFWGAWLPPTSEQRRK